MTRSKLTPSHSTATPLARELYEFVRPRREVTKIGFGVIKPAPGGDRQRVQIDRQPAALLVICRGQTAIQELRIYSGDDQATQLALARYIRDRGYELSFRKQKPPGK